MILARAMGAVSAARLDEMRLAVGVIRGAPAGAPGLPSCTKDRGRCVRRWLLVAGGYWPVSGPANVNSNGDAATAVRSLQRDLGVSVDGLWGSITQGALEAALGMPVPETGIRPAGRTSGGPSPGSPGDVTGPGTMAVGFGTVLAAGLGLTAVLATAVWLVIKSP